MKTEPMHQPITEEDISQEMFRRYDPERAEAIRREEEERLERAPNTVEDAIPEFMKRVVVPFNLDAHAAVHLYMREGEG